MYFKKMFKCSTFHDSCHCFHRLSFHLLQPPPLLSFPLNLSVIISDHLPLMARAHSREIGTQMVIKFTKIRQSNRPQGLVHRPDAIAIDKWNDAVDEGFIQNFVRFPPSFRVAVRVLVVDDSQQIHLDECGHTISVQTSPRFLPPLRHPHRLSFHMGSLRPHSPFHRLFSMDIDKTAQAAQRSSSRHFSFHTPTKVNTDRLKARSEALGHLQGFIPRPFAKHDGT